ncbi:MAG TPA: hypothetical protein VH369_23020 [Bryobacteraceae bacterium]|jgi:hypothetical protein
MKGMESVLLAAIVSLLGLGVWRAQSWLPNLRSAASSLTSAVTKSAAGKTPAAMAGKPAADAAKTKKAHVGRLPEASSLNAPDLSNPENATVVPVEWHTRFPNAPELVAGTTRTELRNKYGAPLLKVATQRDGTLIEQYYYSTSDHTHFTVATLHNGTVVGAESVSR